MAGSLLLALCSRPCKADEFICRHDVWQVVSGVEHVRGALWNVGPFLFHCSMFVFHFSVFGSVKYKDRKIPVPKTAVSMTTSLHTTLTLTLTSGLTELMISSSTFLREWALVTADIRTNSSYFRVCIRRVFIDVHYSIVCHHMTVKPCSSLFRMVEMCRNLSRSLSDSHALMFTCTCITDVRYAT